MTLTKTIDNLHKTKNRFFNLMPQQKKLQLDKDLIKLNLMINFDDIINKIQRNYLLTLSKSALKYYFLR
jgi:hypothetical protein